MKFTVQNRSQSGMTLFQSTCLFGHSELFCFLTRHFVLTGSMWSVVFLASEACRQQRTEHFLAGLWESPLTVLSLPLIKNVFYDLLLSRPVCPPRRFSLRKSLNPCSAPPRWPSVSPCRNVRAKQADTLFSLRYKNITKSVTLLLFTRHLCWWVKQIHQPLHRNHLHMVGLLANFQLQ